MIAERVVLRDAFKVVEGCFPTDEQTSQAGQSVCAAEDRLIVFGGFERGHTSADTWICHLSTMNWRKIRTSGKAPLGRLGHTACIVNGQMYTFGGIGVGGEPFCDEDVSPSDIESETHDPVKTQIASDIVKQAQVQYHAESEVLRCGHLLNQFRLDLKTLVWQELPVPKEHRAPLRFHSSVAWEGKLVHFGGISGSKASNLTRVYDVVSSQWLPLCKTNRQLQIEEGTQKNNSLSMQSSVPTVRSGHSACLWKGMMIVFGGRLSRGCYSSELFAYRVRSFCWRGVVQVGREEGQLHLPTARAFHSASIVGSKMIVVGGVASQAVREELTSSVAVPEDSESQSKPSGTNLLGDCFVCDLQLSRSRCEKKPQTLGQTAKVKYSLFAIWSRIELVATPRNWVKSRDVTARNQLQCISVNRAHHTSFIFSPNRAALYSKHSADVSNTRQPKLILGLFRGITLAANTEKPAKAGYTFFEIGSTFVHPRSPTPRVPTKRAEHSCRTHASALHKKTDPDDQSVQESAGKTECNGVHHDQQKETNVHPNSTRLVNRPQSACLIQRTPCTPPLRPQSAQSGRATRFSQHRPWLLGGSYVAISDEFGFCNDLSMYRAPSPASPLKISIADSHAVIHRLRDNFRSDAHKRDLFDRYVAKAIPSKPKVSKRREQALVRRMFQELPEKSEAVLNAVKMKYLRQMKSPIRGQHEIDDIIGRLSSQRLNTAEAIGEKETKTVSLQTSIQHLYYDSVQERQKVRKCLLEKYLTSPEKILISADRADELVTRLSRSERTTGWRIRKIDTDTPSSDV
ncbi:hypothetical protein DIPPA_60606 [Diplonema papillatum]|nr:hypothetical protein DIPPA_60606 [Diplonema papillatum]